MSFNADVATDGDVRVLGLHGEIDGSADEGLNAAYADAVSTDPRDVLLDFGGVSYINSTGIALIVGLLAEARGSNRAISARGLSEHYREIFDITRISDHIRIIDEEEATDGQS